MLLFKAAAFIVAVRLARVENLSPMTSESLDGNESIFSQRTHPFEPWLDDVQVAALLKVHPKTVQKMARNGELPAIRVGRYWRFLASALNSWIQQSMVKSLSPVAHAEKGIQ